MIRSYIFSTLLHIIFFGTIMLSGRTSFKAVPQFEVYKVSIAPMPQPKIFGTPAPADESSSPKEKVGVEKKTIEKKPPEKSPPEEKSAV